jgi:hypothetical protein
MMNIEHERKRLTEQAVTAFSHFVEENVEKFGRVLESEEPNRPRIDGIEQAWGELKTQADQVISELYNGLAKTVTEKELLAKKKRELGQQGITVRNGGNCERRIQTIYGELRLVRSILKATRERGAEGERVHETVPLDEYLGIAGLPFKMTKQMMDETAFWGQNQLSFRMAEEILRKLYGTGITDEHIREVTYHVGEGVFGRDQERAQEAEEKIADIPYGHDKPGILYLMVDGAAINTRKKDEHGSSWRENKLGLVFSSDDLHMRKDGETQDIRKKEYVSYIGTVEEFKKHLFESALRNGYGRYQSTVIISDGATWIRNMGEELFPDAVQILDFYHLAENIYSFAKHLYGEEPAQYKPWADELIGLAREGKSGELLRRLEPYQGRKLPAGVVNLYTYVKNNREKIDYVRYREKDIT